MKLSQFCLSFIFFCTIAGIFCTTAVAETRVEYPEDTAARLQQAYDSMKSLSFSFVQRSQGSLSGRPRSGSGTALFYKSGEDSRMRWDYLAPDKQVLISDGTTFSMYFKELQQMIITPASELNNDLVYSFFSGRAKIETSFHILPPDEKYLTPEAAAGELAVIKLVPQTSDSQVHSIHLWVNPQSILQKIEIRDFFETITEIEISDIKVNPLAESSPQEIVERFHFTAPEGTEIIQQ